MTAQETHVTNAAESELTSALGVGEVTINVLDTTGFPSVPFYLTIEPASDAKREIVLVDGTKTATTFTLSGVSSRGQDGTTDVAHDAGVKVKVVPVAALWTDINDRVDTKADTSAVVRKAGGDTITASGAAVIPLVVKGAASQTANLLEAKRDDGSVAALVSPSGALAIGGVGPAIVGRASIHAGSAGTIGLVVRGAASQTANLFEAQNSSGVVLAGFSAAGRPIFDNSVVSTTASAGATAQPTNVRGFLSIEVAGVLKKVPYYDA